MLRTFKMPLVHLLILAAAILIVALRVLYFQVFVTVKGINGAGLATSSSSNGVYLSYLSQGLKPLTQVYLADADPSSPYDV